MKITNLKKFVKNNKNRQDAFWYDEGETIMRFDYGQYTVETFVIGEKRLSVVNGGYDICDAFDLEEYGITTDKDLYRALDEGALYCENNNWFEFSIFDNKNKKCIADGCLDDTVLDSLTDALDEKGLLVALKERIEEE